VTNDLRQHTKLLQAVTCILGLADADSGLVRLTEEMGVSLDPWSQPEFALCRDDILFSATQTIAAGGAGFRSVAQIVNDTNDRIMVIDPRTSISLAVNGSVQFSRTSTLATTDAGLANIVRDGRYLKAAAPGARLRSQNNAALPAGFTNGIFSNQTIGTATGGVSFLEVPVILAPVQLLPGNTLAAFSGTDNIVLTVTWHGRTRRIVNNRDLSGQ
jgi:hypothetical protein